MFSREAKDPTPDLPASDFYGYSTEVVQVGILSRFGSLLQTAPILGLIVIGAVVIAGHPSIRSHLAASPPNEGLRVPSMSLMSRQVDAEAPVAWPLPIYNASSDTIEVVDLNTNCAFASIEPRSFQVAPSATQVVLVKFNFASMQTSDPKETPLPFEVSVVPEVKGVSHRLEGWNLPVEVVLPSEDDPSVVQRGE